MGFRTKKLSIVLLTFALCGCEGDSSPGDATLPGAQEDTQASSAGEPEAAQDTTQEPEAISEPDAVGASHDVMDAGGEESECGQLCAPYSECEEFTVEECVTACETTNPGGCERDCLAGGMECGALALCVGIAPAGVSFVTGDVGYEPRDLAGGFSVETKGGVWSFELERSDSDVYMFLLHAPGYDYPEQLWNSMVKFWLLGAPANVHAFFVSSDGDPTVVDEMEGRVNKALEKFDQAEQCSWSRRLHYVTTSATQISGWLGNMYSVNGFFAFFIDRFQKVRPAGLLSLPGGTGGPTMDYLNNEVEYFNFEWEREQVLAAEEVTLVPVFEGETGVKNQILEVTFPSAEEMAQFDTLEIDYGAYCEGHRDENCGEWDYLSHFYVCDQFTAENPYAQESCQPHISAVVEVLGTCGEEGPECDAETDCGEGLDCMGYVPGSEEIVADTKECSCVLPGGELSAPGERVHTCQLTPAVQGVCSDDAEMACEQDADCADGECEGYQSEMTGYADCNCACDTEMMRWITTYSREGRWVSDISQTFAWVKQGGTQRLRINAGNPYDTEMNFRLSNRGKGYRSSELHFLFAGGGYNETYNDKYEPLSVTVPADVTRVELFAFITGHGFGVEADNCAEFCNHTHHFTINDVENVHTNEWADDKFGCLHQIDVGTVPNQYGTWPYGRGGWCPGMDVKPYVADVTDQIALGEENVITYKSLFKGEPYVPVPVSSSGGGFPANVRMNSWLVFYR